MNEKQRIRKHGQTMIPKIISDYEEAERSNYAMATEEWAKELKKKTTIMEKTFEDNHLELLGFSFSSDNNSLHCYVEISTRNEDETVEDYYVKLNALNIRPGRLVSMMEK